MRLVAPELDATAEAALLDALEERETRGLVAAPGAPALLASIPSGRWGIVTSGSRAIATLRLGVAGIEPPAVFVTGDEVQRGKPDPECYLLGARRIGVAPRDCVVIEDSPPGVAAGKAAGMRVIAVLTTHAAEAVRAADRRVASLADVTIRPTAGGLTLELSPG
jgi:sugar-phosphatase